MATQEISANAKQSYVQRFTLAQRVEHIVLLVTFSTLGLTGLIQKFAGSPVSEALIRALGGIESVRTIHHIAAILLLIQCAYHVIVVLHRTYVRRYRMTMLPGTRDVVDAIDQLRYNLGLTNQHPHLPRYNFAEKAEYWAMVWGTAVMAITGFVLWNPILTARILPGEFIPAAKAAHGGEAILAVLAILVWHLYNVHIKMFNRSIFTGKMTRHQMVEEHAEELAEIEAGRSRPAPEPAAMRRRERLFLPVAILLAAISILGIVWFVSYETTAVATVPPIGGGPAFAPLGRTPSPSPTVDNGSLGVPIPHPVEGREECTDCHGATGVRPFPPDHAGRPDASCQVCHTPAEGTVAGAPGGTGESIAAVIPHAVEGKEQCSQCHGGDGSLVPMPAAHAGPFSDDACQLCHKPAAQQGAGAATPEAGGTPEAGPKAIPHPIEGDAYQDCTVCHGAGKVKPFPENHASFSADSCTTCHQPAATETAPTPEASGATPTSEAGDATPTAEAGGATPTAVAGATAVPEDDTASASGPKPIPHSIVDAAYQDCALCHGPDKIKPYPPSHEAFPVAICAGCHQPQQEQ